LNRIEARAMTHRPFRDTARIAITTIDSILRDDQ